METNAGVVLVAAGAGRRFGRPKALVELEGQSLLARSAAAFAGFHRKVAVLRAADLGGVELPGWTLVAGGERRRDSVARGLAAIEEELAVVLVHDAARPLVSGALIRRVLQAAASSGAAVPALPVTDTIKRVEGDRVVETPARAGLVAVQTPQGFRLPLLRRALAASPADATDEAALVEALGEPVRTVPGDPKNLKITTPLDLLLAECLLRTP